jgi:hypothetical protein
MRIAHKHFEGDYVKVEHKYRLKKAFLWWWKTIDHETRFWERVEWIEEWGPWQIRPDQKPWWSPWKWVPDGRDGEELVKSLNEI